MTFFIRFLEHYSYVGIFAVLFLCGLGLPIPEEVTLLGSGYLVHAGYTRLYETQAVCLAAVLAGDVCAFYAGRHWGVRLLARPWVRRVLTPSRMDKVHDYFRRYGAKTVFAARFFAGVRVCTFFVAGTLRMKAWKFLVLDGIAALLSVPVSVWLGCFFGSNLPLARKELRHWHHAVILGILALFGLAVAVRWWRRSRAAGAPPPAAGEVPRR